MAVATPSAVANVLPIARGAVGSNVGDGLAGVLALGDGLAAVALADGLAVVAGAELAAAVGLPSSPQPAAARASAAAAVPARRVVRTTRCLL
ncbi:hypothetical protein Nm8I071_38080 [Nonomuraea sp. TT08I-71]|nr:hypothetical protein Nm8I071_38080 [Nonomuraea sp. TT08I-71]